MSLTEASDSWQIHSEVSEAYTLEGHHGLEIDSTLMRFGREVGEGKQSRAGSHMCDYRWRQKARHTPAHLGCRCFHCFGGHLELGVTSGFS